MKRSPLAPRLAVTFTLLVVPVTTAVWGVGREEPTQLQPQSPHSDETLRTGELLFRVYCRNCHGQDARGDGEMASVLRVRPPNLTRLKARNGGVFPAKEVAAAIDGRTKIGPHGGQTMPVWGLSFQEPGRVGDQEPEVVRQVGALVLYLESMQE